MRQTLKDDQQAAVVERLNGLVEEHNRELFILYSEMKLRLPTYLKTATVGLLKDAGANVDPDISFPAGAEERIRKHMLLLEKIREVGQILLAQIKQYYKDLKDNMPEELLKKRSEELDDEEWVQLGFDIDLIRKYRPADQQTD